MEEHVGCKLFGFLAEILCLLRAVNTVEPNLGLLIVAVDDRYRVSVSNFYDFSGDRLGVGD